MPSKNNTFKNLTGRNKHYGSADVSGERCALFLSLFFQEKDDNWCIYLQESLPILFEDHKKLFKLQANISFVFFWKKIRIFFFSFSSKSCLSFTGRMLQKTSTRTEADEDEDKKKSTSFFFFLKRNLLILEINTYFACNLYKGGHAGVCFDISKWDKKPKK